MGSEGNHRPRAGFGVELRGGGASLGRVDLRRLRELVTEHGLVLLRGYDVTVEALHAFTSTLFDRRLVYGGMRDRVTEDDAIQTAEIGFQAIGLHSEMAYTPVRPDLLVFSCEVPAASGGETLVGDGCAVWSALSPSARALLASHRLRYHNVVRRPAWERMFGTGDPRRVVERLAAVPDCTVTFADDGTLVATHLQWAVVDGPRGPAYADSLHRFPTLEPDAFVFGLKKTWVELEDGPLPTELHTEVHDACARCAREIGWHAGDVVVLDNWSVLHGRTAFRDPGRRILTSFGHVDGLAASRRPLVGTAVRDRGADRAGA